MEAVVGGLSSRDEATSQASVRKIKHLIIGNNTKKRAFMLLGAVPQLASLLADSDSASDELVCEVVITLGSFAYGSAEDVRAVVAAGTLPLLSKGLLHPSPAVLLCCLRTLRTLYSFSPSSLNSDPTLHSTSPSSLDSDPIFQDRSISRKLVSLLSEPHPLAQCAAAILANACQSCDHQNLLCAHGIIDPLVANLLSPVVKLVQGSLLCLAALIRGNTPAAHLVASASCKGHPFISTLMRLLSNSHCSYIKLLTAKCVVCLYKCGIVDSCSPPLTLKVLPTLVRLSQDDLETDIRTQAITTLAHLTESELSLQELAANSAHLIPSLVQCLSQPPDPTSDYTTDSLLLEFEQLCGGILQLLASLASSKEEIRCKVSGEGGMMGCLATALAAGNMEVKVAAARCLLSLSRSTKLLRTCVFDHDCWRPILAMLAVADLQCLQVSSAVLPNLLLPFSPSRESLVAGGIVVLLVSLLEHADEVVKVNSLWALMSLADGCSEEIKHELISSLSYDKLIRLLSPCTAPPLLLKAIGLLVNLTQDRSSDWALMLQETNLLVAVEMLLGHGGSVGSGSSGGVVEQCLCVLVNLSGCCEDTRQLLVHREAICKAVNSILRASDNVAVLMAAVEYVRNLVTTEGDSSHVHRQNCLKEIGVNFALQKLEKKEHKRLRSRVREVLESLTS